MKRSELILESMRAFIRISVDLVRSLKLLWILVPMIALAGCSEGPLEPAAGRVTAQLCSAEPGDHHGLDGCGRERIEEARRGRKLEK